MVFATGNLLAAMGDTLKGKTVAIQGFGNVGSYAAQFYAAAGARVRSPVFLVEGGGWERGASPRSIFCPPLSLF